MNITDDYADRAVEGLFSVALQRDKLFKVSIIKNTMAMPLEESFSHS